MTSLAQTPVELSPRFTLARAGALIAVLAFVTVASFAMSARFGEQPISLSTAFVDRTSTDSAICPTVSCKSTRWRELTFTVTLLAIALEKPGCSAETW